MDSGQGHPSRSPLPAAAVRVAYAGAAKAPAEATGLAGAFFFFSFSRRGVGAAPPPGGRGSGLPMGGQKNTPKKGVLAPGLLLFFLFPDADAGSASPASRPTQFFPDMGETQWSRIPLHRL